MQAWQFADALTLLRNRFDWTTLTLVDGTFLDNEAQVAEMDADETKMAKAEDIIGRYRHTLQVLAK